MRDYSILKDRTRPRARGAGQLIPYALQAAQSEQGDATQEERERYEQGARQSGFSPNRHLVLVTRVRLPFRLRPPFRPGDFADSRGASPPFAGAPRRTLEAQ